MRKYGWDAGVSLNSVPPAPSFDNRVPLNRSCDRDLVELDLESLRTSVPLPEAVPPVPRGPAALVAPPATSNPPRTIARVGTSLPPTGLPTTVRGCSASSTAPFFDECDECGKATSAEELLCPPVALPVPGR